MSQRLDSLKNSVGLVVISLTFFSLAHPMAQGRKFIKGIDANLAFAHVEKLVSLGPGPSGSPGISQAQSYISDVLRKLNLEINHQDFLAATPNGNIGMKNILAKIPGQKDQVVLLASHYDTKLMHNALFVGANDGGSSTGLLLELARVISQQERICPVWFAFFDGEEAQKEWTETDSLYGSRYFVEQLKAQGTVKKIKAMILMDMIGDKDLLLERDLSSTPWLVDLVWKSARELGYGKYLANTPRAMLDDHIPFTQAGVPAVDLIDYSFGFNNLYWHTASDALDKVSPQSLKIVGELVLRTLNKLCAK